MAFLFLLSLRAYGPPVEVILSFTATGGGYRNTLKSDKKMNQVAQGDYLIEDKCQHVH